MRPVRTMLRLAPKVVIAPTAQVLCRVCVRMVCMIWCGVRVCRLVIIQTAYGSLEEGYNSTLYSNHSEKLNKHS